MTVGAGVGVAGAIKMRRRVYQPDFDVRVGKSAFQDPHGIGVFIQNQAGDHQLVEAAHGAAIGRHDDTYILA